MICARVEDKHSFRSMSMRLFMIAALAWILSGSVSAQATMADVLRHMPDSIVPYLTENNRLDCIDFKDSNMDAVVRNSLEGKSELKVLSGRYADFQLNESHRMQLRLLDVTEPVDGARQIICLVHTLGTDIRQSRVEFFTFRWQPLDTKRFVALPEYLFTASLDEQQEVLTITPSDYFDKPAMEDQKQLEILSISLKWQNDFFNKVKK